MTMIGTEGGALPTDPSSHGSVRFADNSGHVVAGILAIISLAGLTAASAYVRETASWATQAIIIPLHVIAGVSLLWRRSLGFVLAASLLVFDILMTASIAFLTVMLDVRGLATGALPITIAMTLVAVSAAALVVSMLHGLRARHWRPWHVIP